MTSSAQITRMVINGEVAIGMTRTQVLEALGPPTRRNETITATGTTDQWVYGLGQYVHFTNGRVTSIHTSR